MTSEPLTVEELAAEWLKENLGIRFYETQERAFAPGIADGWPPIIKSPHSKHGRLKLIDTYSLLPKLSDLLQSHSRQLWLEAAEIAASYEALLRRGKKWGKPSVAEDLADLFRAKAESTP